MFLYCFLFIAWGSKELDKELELAVCEPRRTYYDEAEQLEKEQVIQEQICAALPSARETPLVSAPVAYTAVNAPLSYAEVIAQQPPPILAPVPPALPLRIPPRFVQPRSCCAILPSPRPIVPSQLRAWSVFNHVPFALRAQEQLKLLRESLKGQLQRLKQQQQQQRGTQTHSQPGSGNEEWVMVSLPR
ncbi:hypothetical protein HPB50_025929 [Hyalomma asiaticum]|uniref:Uncharacterized protein n=1 Tax=Hyalomma asiaticum TaxID=266040 RepID=A0ACB7S451_HYAAI|nr:hypothetical protein HPB50_025929 [Hyalomma asiaticum]